MGLVTKARLERLCPTAKQSLLEAVSENWRYAEDRGINTPLRVQMFIGIVAVETGGLRSIDENLNYTTAKRLMEVWPTRFTSTQAAQPYLRNPEALAGKVYGDRLGNRHPGDGYRYRGGGFIQVTGRENYRTVGHEHDPERLQDPTIGFKAAVDYWQLTGCNDVADMNDPEAMRRKVNGGTNGMKQFEAYLTKARKIFVAVPVQPGSAPLSEVDEPRSERSIKQDVGLLPMFDPNKW